MTKRYLIQDLDTHNFWSTEYRRFKSFLFADRFETQEKALDQAKRDNVGIFKITETYDTK